MARGTVNPRDSVMIQLPNHLIDPNFPMNRRGITMVVKAIHQSILRMIGAVITPWTMFDRNGVHVRKEVEESVAVVDAERSEEGDVATDLILVEVAVQNMPGISRQAVGTLMQTEIRI